MRKGYGKQKYKVKNKDGRIEKKERPSDEWLGFSIVRNSVGPLYLYKYSNRIMICLGGSRLLGESDFRSTRH